MNVANKRIVTLFSILLLFQLGIIPFYISIEPLKAQNDRNFEQEIFLSLNDITESSIINRPIDIKIEFENDCFAKNESVHSIIIGYKESNEFIELESQIYNLERLDADYISACRIVFLYPDLPTCPTAFLVRYSDEMTEQISYPSHLSLKKSHFHYEPISGQSIDFDYYSITQDGVIPYAISTKGTLFGNGISQVVAKLKPNTKIVDTTSIDQFASFSMLLSTKELADDEYIGTSFSTEVKSTVLVEGNLLVKLQVDCISPEGLIKTSNVYSYYYCPDEPKSINVEINHEILKTCDLGESKTLDGTYAYLLSFHSTSNAIEKLNMGNILPETYFYGEDDRVHSYAMPENPDSSESEIILDTIDDVDLGSEAWMCIHDPKSGKTHGLLYGRNHSITEKDQDGLQVKSFVEESLKIPGLEVDTGSFFTSRNHYDEGKQERLVIEEGFSASLDVSFITFEQGTWQDVANESAIYRQLLPFRKVNMTADGEGDEPEELYTLSGSITGSNSIPFGSLLSAYTGRNFSYISAELYEEESLVCTSIASRLPLHSVSPSTDTSSLKGIIQVARSIIDWRNLSIFKSFTFPAISPGDYVIKIYKENPFLPDTRKFIAYKTIQLKDDQHVFLTCKKQVELEAMVTDQNDQSLSDTEIQLYSDDFLISSSQTNIDGMIHLSIPWYRDHEYKIVAFYKNVEIYSEPISFSLLNYWLTKPIDIKIPLYDVRVVIYDEWDLAPDAILDPELSFNKDRKQPIILSSVMKSNDLYAFNEIPEETYLLNLVYKNYRFSQAVHIDQDQSIGLSFPVTYEITVNVYDRLGLAISDVSLTFDREDKTRSYNLTEENLTVSIPPGTYQISIQDDDSIIAKQSTLVFTDADKFIITEKESPLLLLGYIIAAILFISSIGIGFKRRKYNHGFLLLFASLLLISALSPWWILNGSTNDVNTETSIHLLPTQMISFVETESLFSGQFHDLPDDADFALDVLLLLFISTFLILIIIQFLPSNYKKIITGFYFINIFVLTSVIIGFIYFVSQLTIIGVGSIIGSGSITFTLIGETSSIPLQADWGFGSGLYFGLFALLILVLYPFVMKRTFGSWFYRT